MKSERIGKFLFYQYTYFYFIDNKSLLMLDLFYHYFNEIITIMFYLILAYFKKFIINIKFLNLSDLIWSNILDEPDNLTPEYSALIESRIKKITSSINNSNLCHEYYNFLISKRNEYFWNKRNIITKKIITYFAYKCN